MLNLIRNVPRCSELDEYGGKVMIKNKVKGYRTMLGLTQKDLAELLDLSSQSVSNKERGFTSFTDEEKLVFRELVKDIIPDITIDEIFY